MAIPCVGRGACGGADGTAVACMASFESSRVEKAGHASGRKGEKGRSKEGEERE